MKISDNVPNLARRKRISGRFVWHEDARFKRHELLACRMEAKRLTLLELTIKHAQIHGDTTVRRVGEVEHETARLAHRFQRVEVVLSRRSKQTFVEEGLGVGKDDLAISVVLDLAVGVVAHAYRAHAAIAGQRLLDVLALLLRGEASAIKLRATALAFGNGLEALRANNLPPEDRVMLAGVVSLVVNDRFHPGFAPAVLERCVWAHSSAEPGHRVMTKYLGVEPLLDLGMRLGEGSGAALAWPLLVSAVRLLAEMASFESAGVSDAGTA